MFRRHDRVGGTTDSGMMSSSLGQGNMATVVLAVWLHAFDDLGLENITAHVFSFNDASARVLEKCGFEQEGYFKKHFVKDGKFIDAKAYGLTKCGE